MHRLSLVAALALAAVAALRGARGIPVRELDKRIFGGEFVPDSEAPYAVAVYKWKPDGSGSVCGGTLISDRHVVTAAHCLTSIADKFKDSYRVEIGYKSQQRDKQTKVLATKVDIHPDYQAKEDDKYDIAVLTIPRVEFGKAVQRMPVYDGGLEPKQPLLAVGWGRTESDDGLPNSLKKTMIEIGQPDQCKRFKSEFDNSNGPRVCALKSLTPGKGICMGDSGSGVSIDRDGKQYFVGLGSRIVFFGGTACGSSDSASFFVHISSQLDFIMRSSGLTKEYLLDKKPEKKDDQPKPTQSGNDDDDLPPPANEKTVTATVTKTVYLVMALPT
ncbi:hypothetical protein H4R19_004469 [Coemansia spiralis]|nr:hypothetical protein H4R19_004469 [Coemansia spiralis]